MAIYRLLQEASFGPNEIRVMTEAYENVLRALRLADRNDPVTEIVAKKIIEVARNGERGPDRIAALAVEQIGLGGPRWLTPCNQNPEYTFI